MTTYKIAEQQYISDLSARTASNELQLLHCALGVASEYSELMAAIIKVDTVNIVEEIGDMAWYIAMGIRTMPIDFDINNYKGDHSINCTAELRDLVSDIADVAKRSHFYVMPDYDRLGLVLQKFWFLLKELTDLYVTDRNMPSREDAFLFVLEKNIAKLKIRFPHKFDADSAVNRNTDAERRELEK
jgi:NTP pyrophosphatase (non-canonical NTP hydrolase)